MSVVTYKLTSMTVYKNANGIMITSKTVVTLTLQSAMMVKTLAMYLVEVCLAVVAMISMKSNQRTQIMISQKELENQFKTPLEMFLVKSSTDVFSQV
jgi:hypothetical protein